MNTIKHILIIFAALLWAGGVIGGIGMAVYLKSPVMVVAILVLGILAFPTVKRLLTADDKK
jgi:hypothetical protein